MLQQPEMPPLCPRLLVWCGDLTPASVPLPSELQVQSHSLSFSSSFLHPSEVCLNLYIPFQWSWTPAISQLVLCEILCIWICIPDASVEGEVLYVHILLCHLVVSSLLFNPLSRFVITFLPRRKWLLISWLQSLSTVIFRAQEKKICHCFYFPPFYLPWNDGIRCRGLSFLNAEFQASFSLSFTLIKRLFNSSSLSTIKSGIICISKVVDISASSLDSSLWFIALVESKGWKIPSAIRNFP